MCTFFTGKATNHIPTWKPPMQQSVALESYLEEVKSELADLKK